MSLSRAGGCRSAKCDHCTLQVWRITPNDTEVAGYATQAADLTYVLVRGAGHLVPFDQPERAYDMITRFIDDIPYHSFPDPRA